MHQHVRLRKKGEISEGAGRSEERRETHLSVSRDEVENGEDGRDDENSSPDEETRGDEKGHEGSNVGDGLLFRGVESWREGGEEK